MKSHLGRPKHAMAEDTLPGCGGKSCFSIAGPAETAQKRFAQGEVLPTMSMSTSSRTSAGGSLVDAEGPAQGIECKASEFIWREERSRM